MSAAHDLVGRDAESALLRGLLTRDARAAVVTGLAGSGKSAVAGHVCSAAAADGTRVVAAAGRAAERDLPLAVLVDLVRRLGLPVPETAADPLRLRLEVLALLEEYAEEQPLLVVVDDVQWVDESSLSVLAFAAHRLGPSRASMLLTVRGALPPSLLADLPRVELGPLDRVHSGLLLRRLDIPLDRVARAAVLDRAAGNPLALVELARSVAAGAAGTFGEVDPPTTVEAVYAAELTGLPTLTRTALLLVALGADDLGALGRAIGADAALDALAPAEAVGLARVEGRTPLLRHPLVAAAVRRTSTAAERRSAHLALVAAYDGDADRCAWHRGQAAVLPDEKVASALVEAAERARQRGAHLEASRAMTRAAELSEVPVLGEERMLAALGLSLPSGHSELLADLARRVRSASADPLVRARASHFVAYGLAQTTRQAAARQALIDALGQLVELDVDHGWGSLTTLASLAYQSGGDAELVRSWLTRYEAKAMPTTYPAVELTEAARAWIRVAIDPLARPADLLRLVREAPYLEGLHPPEVDASRQMMLGAAAWVLDETRVALGRLTDAVVTMRRSHAAGQLPQTLFALGYVQVDLALYDEADQTGRLLVDLGEAENHRYTGEIGSALRARVAALRGDVDEARTLALGLLRRVEVGQSLALECNLGVVLGLVDAADGDVAGSYERLRALFRPGGEPVHDHVSHRHLGDLVAAAVRAGRTDDLAPVLALARPRLAASGGRLRLQLARADALLAGADAEVFHQAATEDPVAARWPFELANAQLEYGVWLRRRQRPTAARGHLRAAYDVFERVGARPWAALARAELRAAGVVVEADAGSGWSELTAQEREVVRLAASGLSNREIGATLYLSPRTVGAHLYHAFPKLGVTSRAQLRDQVAGDER